MRAIFAGVGWTDGAPVGNSTPSGSNASAGNLLSDRRSEFWRTASDANFAFVNINLGVVRAISTVALMDVVGPPTLETRVTVRTAATEGGLPAGKVFALDQVVPTAADGGRHFLSWSQTPANDLWLRIEIEHDGAAVQQLGASRLVVGGEWSPVPGMLLGSGVVTPGSASAVTETDAGGKFIRHLYTRRIARPVLEVRRSDYIGPFSDLVGFSGTNRPILFAQHADLDMSDPALALEANKGMVYGALPDIDAARAEFYDGFSIVLDLEEWT